MTTTDTYIESMRKDGYCIIENAFPEDFCGEVLDAMHRIQEEKDIRPFGGFAGDKTVRIMNLLQYDDLFQQVPTQPDALAVLHGYLDPECLLSGIDSSEIYPGQTAQPIHTDTWWHDNHRFDFPVCVNSIMTLSEFTDANGATRIVPGSHRWTAEEVAFDPSSSDFPLLPGEQPTGYDVNWKPIAAEAPKGSILMYDSRMMHGGGANVSDKPRPGIISPYVLPWLRQLDNFAYAIPLERQKTFSPELRKLIGLGLVRGGYSQVNGMSPEQFLWPELSPA